MSTLSRDDILSADDLKIKKMSVPEWGGDIYVRQLNSAQKDSFEASIINGDMSGKKMNLENAKARLAVLTICDEKGKRLFSKRDVEELGKKSGVVLSQIFTVAQDLNSITDTQIEELAGNSEGILQDVSGSN